MRIKFVTCAIAAVLLLAACGSDNKSSTAGSSKSTTTAAASSGSGSTNAVVKTSDSKYGQILTTSNGMTVYAFTQDKGGMSSCVDACAAAWPPLKVNSATLPSGLDSATFKVVARSDGSHQLVAGDQPLYTFASDQAAGDVNGQGIGGSWFVVKPDGTLNKSTAAASTTMGSSSKSSGY